MFDIENLLLNPDKDTLHRIAEQMKLYLLKEYDS